MTLFALLNCPGKIADKAEHLYNELQEGGLGEHAQISATDKDIEPVFEKLCGLASFELFAFPNAAGQIYDDAECEQLREQVELVREDQYLEDVYGASSRLKSEEWLAKMGKEARWVFDSKELRKRLLEAASVEAKHC